MKLAVRIVDGPLAETAPVWAPPGAGAVVCFEGVARPTEHGEPIATLDYEAYEPMASRELERLAREVLHEFGLLGVLVEHSRGRVAVGERSFRLRVAALHRKEALAALERFIDRLKQDVPIWKQAVAFDGKGALRT